MALIRRWKPFRDLEKLKGEFDELLDRIRSDSDWFAEWEAGAMRRPPIESLVEGGKLKIRIDIPGIDAKNIKVETVGNILNVRGSREEKHETRKPDFIRRELKYGSFERAMELPVGTDPRKLAASYRDGVLEVTAPVAKKLPARIARVAAKRAKAIAVSTHVK